MMFRKKISVLFAAAECAPFAKVGGLGDVIGSLPQALAHESVAVSVILPKYKFIDTHFKLTKFKPTIILDYNNARHTAHLYAGHLPHNPVTYYFLDHPLIATEKIYGRESGALKNTAPRKHPDVDRFTFFSKAVVEAIHQLKLPCNIIHCHDWHTAYVPTFVDTLDVSHRYPNIPTIFTIHNLANQGISSRTIAKRLGLHPDDTPALMEDYYDVDHHALNAMKLGVLSANIVTTVSPSYAREVRSHEQGAGLATYLERRHKHLYGVLNGIDTAFYNPTTDNYIYKKYSRTDGETGKASNKKSLQKSLGLPAKNVPLYGMVSRLVSQKGLDILIPALKVFLKENVQVALLGAGEPLLEAALKKLAKQFPKNFSVTIHFDIPTAQRIYAASDFFLMPSLFEPCGLGQLIAMRYGTIPLVRATGGLKDTVRDGKTGIVFAEYSETALLRALKRSFELYGNKRAWYTMVGRAMKQDFSWGRSAREYIRLYKKLL